MPPVMMTKHMPSADEREHRIVAQHREDIVLADEAIVAPGAETDDQDEGEK
jgi:hypothetical protein